MSAEILEEIAKYNKELDEILDLSLHNPAIHIFMTMYRRKEIPYQKMLECLVIHLAKSNKNLTDELLKVIENYTHPGIIIPKEKNHL